MPFFERRSVSVVPSSLWRSLDTPTAAGVSVTADSALTFSAVFAAHKILAESVAMLPLFMLKRTSKGKEPAPEHPLYPILHDVANPEMDAYLVRETLTSHLAGWGRAHAKIDYDARGRITSYWPIHPGRVEVRRDAAKQIVFVVTLPDGQTRTYKKWEMLHLRGMSPDGVSAYSPIKLARQGIGLAIAAEAYGASFFGNGAAPQGILIHPNRLDEDVSTRIRDSWNQAHQGIGNANKIALLEEGMSYEKIGIPPDDAQFLQTRQFQVEEVARWYRIPAPMLAMTDKAMTYASVEAFGIQFVIYTLYPWLVRWEKAISAQLLLERERKDFFAEHLMTALLRGDTTSRYQAYATGRQWGWMSVNDIRTLENMNRIEGGDIYLTPLNMTSGSPPAKVQKSYLPVFADAVMRILRREINDVRAAMQKILVKRGAEEFIDWLGDFYTEHQDFIVRSLTSPAMSFAELIAEGSELDVADVNERTQQVLKAFALRRATLAQEMIKNAVSENEPGAALEQLFNEWDAPYAERLARMELSQHTAVLAMPAKEPSWMM